MSEEEKKQFASSEDLFWNLISDGLDRTGRDTEEYLARIKKEFSVIKKGGFVDYFLILWDIVRFARENKILTGIGRGSAGGSLIAYLLGIIKLDPLEFDLLFERFLNEGRMSSLEKKDVYVCQTPDGDIELDFKKTYTIFRDSKKMIVHGSELQEGDQLTNFK